MNLTNRTKKILAKEFLFALGTVILFYSVIAICIILEKRNSEEISEIRSRLDTVTTYNALPYRLSLFKYIHDELPTQYTVAKELGLRKDFLEQIKYAPYAEDVRNIVQWESSKNINTSNIEELLEEDIIADLSGNYLNNILIPLEDKLSETNHSFFNSFYTSNKKDIILYVLVFVMFGLRYIFYATKWSLCQLKNT
jgi:hypothetical protein